MFFKSNATPYFGLRFADDFLVAAKRDSFVYYKDSFVYMKSSVWINDVTNRRNDIFFNVIIKVS